MKKSFIEWLQSLQVNDLTYKWKYEEPVKIQIEYLGTPEQRALFEMLDRFRDWEYERGRKKFLNET